MSAYRQRRLNNEMVLLRKEFNSSVNISDDTSEILWTTPRGRRYLFFLPEAYPFKPPQIYENGVAYLKTTKQPWMMREYMTKHGECGCVCCTCIITHSRWSPCMKISQIIQNLLREEDRWFQITLRSIEGYIQIPDIARAVAEFV